MQITREVCLRYYQTFSNPRSKANDEMIKEMKEKSKLFVKT